MTRSWTWAVAPLACAAFAAGALAQPEGSAPKRMPDEDNYLHLFNGKNLDGWEIRGNQEDFQVANGIIRSESGGGGQLMFYTAEEFGDFELVVEWRVAAGGNSGVFIRAPEEGWPWETAYEVQISSEDPPRDDYRCTGALYAYAPVDPRPDETPEQWRTFTIRCEGARIQVSVDGEQVIDFDQETQENTREKPLKGFIGVQDSHGPPGTWIEYRVIKVKPL